MPAAVIHRRVIVGNGGLAGAEGEGREDQAVPQAHCDKVAGRSHPFPPSPEEEATAGLCFQAKREVQTPAGQSDFLNKKTGYYFHEILPKYF